MASSAMSSMLPFLLLGGGSTATVLLMMFMMNGGLDMISSAFGWGDDDGQTSVAQNANANAFDVASSELEATGKVSAETAELMNRQLEQAHFETQTRLDISQNDVRLKEIEYEQERQNQEANESEGINRWATAGAGVIGGAAAGAAIGSIVPVIGTGVGAVIGGAAGGLLGYMAGEGVSWPW